MGVYSTLCMRNIWQTALENPHRGALGTPFIKTTTSEAATSPDIRFDISVFPPSPAYVLLFFAISYQRSPCWLNEPRSSFWLLNGLVDERILMGACLISFRFILTIDVGHVLIFCCRADWDINCNAFRTNFILLDISRRYLDAELYQILKSLSLFMFIICNQLILRVNPMMK